MSSLWAADLDVDRIQQARDSGVWVVSENESLLGIARQLLPDQPGRYQEFVRDVTGLNFDIFGSVNRDGFRPGVKIKLPDYILTDTGLTHRLALAEKQKAEMDVSDSIDQATDVEKQDPGDSQQVESGMERVVKARSKGSIVTLPGENMFSLAKLFFPAREAAQQLLIQEVIKLNPEVFDTAKINAIPAGTLLKLPGYVWESNGRQQAADVSRLKSRKIPVTPRKKTVKAVIAEKQTVVAKKEVKIPEESVPAPVLEEIQLETPAASQAVFTDQYLSDDPAYVDKEALEESSQKPGRRVLDVATHYYRNNDDFLGDETETGVTAHYRRETLNYGEIDVDMSVSNLDSNQLNEVEDDTDMLLTVRQTAMPLSTSWLLDTTLGHQRSIASPFLQGGYRFRLPTSPLLGLSGETYSAEEKVHWFLGNTGAYQGVALRQFEEDGGKLAGASYERQLTPSLKLGGKIINLQDYSEVVDHNSILLGGRYLPAGSRNEHELHLLADDDSNLGVWSDSANELQNGYSVKYGGYYIEPELAWTDAAIANDQLGIYSRLDKRGFRHDFSVGYDYFKTGLEDAPTESINHSIYYNNNYRSSKNFTLGLSSNFSRREFKAAENDTQNSWRLQGFVYQRMRLGTSRYEVFLSDQDSDNQSNQRETQGVRWSHDWRTPRRYRLTTEVSAENDKQFDDTQKQWLLGSIFRHDLSDDFSWSVNAAYIRRDSDLSGSSDDISINANSRWQFLPDWYASLNINLNQTTTDADVAGFITDTDEITTDGFWLTLGYSKASGRGYPNFGGGNNKAGAGNIAGTVFYDDNRDGIQQPGEQVASGVIIMLDGRYEARTDSRGRFSFSPVPAGQHYVRLLVEDLPLPWGLDDESPRGVSVNVRQNQEISFPLIRTDQ